MEITIAVVALCVALWQLKLQRNEIRLNSRLNALIYIAGLFREKIEHHEHIIEGLKSRRSDWSGHANCVNGELRPLLARINLELIDSVAPSAKGIDIHAVQVALKLGPITSLKTDGSAVKDMPANGSPSSEALRARRIA